MESFDDPSELPNGERDVTRGIREGPGQTQSPGCAGVQTLGPQLRPPPLPRCTGEPELKQTLSREDSWVLIPEPHVGSNGTCVGFDEQSS